MTVLSLCAGIGGLDLGLERAGFRTVGQVEKDPFCRDVLTRRWPNVPKTADLRDVDPFDWEGVDTVAAGFPCQPHSVAGKRGASADDRDLWPEVRRILTGVRPKVFIGENVPGLLTSEGGDFFAGILRDLVDLGYVVEWEHVPASAVGAPHRRDRVFIVARLDGAQTFRGFVDAACKFKGWPKAGRWDGVDLTARVRRFPVSPGSPWPTPRAAEWKGVGPLGSKSHVYRRDRDYLDAVVQESEQKTGKLNPDWVEWLMGVPIGWTDDGRRVDWGYDWKSDPAEDRLIPRLIDRGGADWKHRIKALGNAVVPAVGELVGRFARGT